MAVRQSQTHPQRPAASRCGVRSPVSTHPGALSGRWGCTPAGLGFRAAVRRVSRLPVTASGSCCTHPLPPSPRGSWAPGFSGHLTSSLIPWPTVWAAAPPLHPARPLSASPGRECRCCSGRAGGDPHHWEHPSTGRGSRQSWACLHHPEMQRAWDSGREPVASVWVEVPIRAASCSL